MNLDSVKEVFLIESSELLESMESSLLELEKDPLNEGAIHAIFRAAHTIKGSGGMFGYQNIVDFTHVAETFLDKVRTGKISVNSDIIAILLECHDHIQNLIDIDTAPNSQGLDEDTKKTGEELLRRLYSMMDIPVPSTVEPVKDPQKIGNEPDNESKSGGLENDFWHISLRLSENAFRHGLDPLSFINYLKTIGEITDLKTITTFLPDIESMDAESCYIGFEINLKAQTNKGEIERVFEFLEGESSVMILPPRTSLAEISSLLRQRNGENNLPDVLVEMGVLLADQKASLDISGESNAGNEQETQNEEKSNEVHPKSVNHPPENEHPTEKNVPKAHALEPKKSIRIDADKLDKLINLVGELVINSANVKRLSEIIGEGDLLEATSVMSRLIEEIRESVMNVRMVEIGESFRRFERVVRDTSRELDKKINLVMQGTDTELDKNLVEKIADPLMHLVRNAMDHGLETPEIRVKNGKDEAGTLQLIAYHDTGSIVIEVKDDGAGLNTEKLLAKAIEKGIASENKKYSDSEIFSLIFEPGLSTATSVTNLSGRGVGMDVVRRNIEGLRGTVEIESALNQGTTIRIRLPLTMAIIDGFLVTVRNSYYVIPLEMVLECIESSEEENVMEKGNHFINFRGEVLPFLRLHEFFQLEEKYAYHTSNPNLSLVESKSKAQGMTRKKDQEERENVIVVKYGKQKAGLVVDELLGQFQTVIKPLGRLFDKLQGISGATILGSGAVALILDVPRLVNHAKIEEKKTIMQNVS